MKREKDIHHVVMMLSVPSPYAISLPWLSSEDGWLPLSYQEMQLLSGREKISWILEWRKEPSHCYRVCSNNCVVWSAVRQLCTFWYTNQGPWYERRIILLLIIYNFVSWRSNRWIKDQQKVWHQFNFENSNLIKLLTFHVFQKLKSLGIIYEGRLWDSINWAMHFALH